MYRIVNYITSVDKGGMQTVAVESGLNPKHFYRALSASGNPPLHPFRALAQGCGLRFAFERIERTEAA